MEARSPESLAVAEAIRDVMKRQGLSGVDLADRLATIRGSRPGDMWISKRRNGAVHLVTPKTRVIEWEPTEDLQQIAQALGVPVEEFVKVAKNPKRRVVIRKMTTRSPGETSTSITLSANQADNTAD